MMKQISPFLFFILLFSCNSLVAQTKAEIEHAKPTRSEVYKKIEGNNDLKVFIFEPEKKVENRACVVFFFGGGWVGGTPKQFFQQADRLAKQGVLAICADYRTKKSHGTSPLEAVKDARSAIKWVRINAQKLGIAPHKIVATGGSAGGHLAVMTGLQYGFARASSDHSLPNAMVLFNPVLDTTAKGFGSEIIGDDKTNLSPYHQVKPGVVPTLVLHGTHDKVVPFENAVRFETLMKKAGNDCTLIPFKGAAHGFFNGKQFRNKETNQNFEATMKSMEKFLHRLGYLQEH